MAITTSALTSLADNVDRNAYTTASIAPSASTLVRLVVGSTSGGTPAIPTAASNTGLNLTWTQISTDVQGGVRLTVFRALSATPGSGTVTIDFGGVTQTGCIWAIAEFAGVDTSGTNGSGAVVQFANNKGVGAPPVSVTLAAFSHANNATFGAFYHQANEGTTPGAAFTELIDLGHASPARALQTEWATSNQTTVDATWATTSAWVGFAMEVKAAPAGGGPLTGNLGLTSETDTAQPFSRLKSSPLSIPTSSSTALTVTRRKSLPIGLASSTGTALPITVGSVTPVLTFASETDLALPITARKIRTLSFPTESSSALVITGSLFTPPPPSTYQLDPVAFALHGIISFR